MPKASNERFISYNSARNKYRTQVTIKGYVVNGGEYADIEDARYARRILIAVRDGEEDKWLFADAYPQEKWVPLIDRAYDYWNKDQKDRTAVTERTVLNANNPVVKEMMSDIEGLKRQAVKDRARIYELEQINKKAGL